VVSRILAFRPASVVERLEPRSHACPLSLRDLLGPASALGIVLPVVRAPVAGVARAALVAAKEHQSALGLALPIGALPEPWFEEVTRTADELAAGLPIFLSAEVMVDGEAPPQVERAEAEVWRLLDAGVTHLAVDVTAVAAPERARVLSEVAAGAVERGIGLDCTVPLEDAAHGAARAGALFEELARRGAPPDVASVRCPEPASRDEARVQVAALARICGALSGVPVMRRGPVTPDLLGLLAGSPVKACDDGGRAAARAVSVIPWELIARDEAGATREDELAQAVRELSDEGADRLEARAYVEVMSFLEALGAPGSAVQLSRALERQLEER
jgi:hypothetical protein